MNQPRTPPVLILLLALACCCLTVARAEVEVYSDSIELFVGQSRVLPAERTRRVAIGNGELADVKVIEDQGQVLLIAKAPGVTDLRIWRKDGTRSNYLVQIAAQPASHILGQVRGHLAGMEGVEARIAGSNVILEGRALSEADFERIASLTKQYPVISYVKRPDFTMKGMVLLDVKVLEVNTNALRKIGVDWDDAIDGLTFGYIHNFQTNPYFNSTLSPVPPATGAIASPFNQEGTASFAGISTRFSSMINLLVQDGTARLLAQPKLSCKSGGQAEFLVGGELPIPITNVDGGISVTFKQFGIILKMSPIADPDGYISTHIDVEVSTVDPSVSVLGIPGFATRKTQTEMNVRQGSSMVLSGLLSTERSKEVEKVPGVGNLPVLGELFKSRQFRNKETELVVFVTPRLIDADATANKAMLQRYEQLMERSEQSLRFDLMD